MDPTFSSISPGYIPVLRCQSLFSYPMDISIFVPSLQLLFSGRTACRSKEPEMSAKAHDAWMDYLENLCSSQPLTEDEFHSKKEIKNYEKQLMAKKKQIMDQVNSTAQESTQVPSEPVYIVNDLVQERDELRKKSKEIDDKITILYKSLFEFNLNSPQNYVTGLRYQFSNSRKRTITSIFLPSMQLEITGYVSAFHREKPLVPEDAKKTGVNIEVSLATAESINDLVNEKCTINKRADEIEAKIKAIWRNLRDTFDQMELEP